MQRFLRVYHLLRLPGAAFTIAVSAVDLAGNAGPPSEIRIYDGGDTEACSTTASGRSASSGVALMLVLLVAAARSTRRHG
jgi:MYXO-CTERM domain-containing protein